MGYPIYKNHRISLSGVGSSKGFYLSHANGKVQLVESIQGDGEIFLLNTNAHSRIEQVYLSCIGDEAGKYLSYSDGVLCLKEGEPSFDEKWYFNKGAGAGQTSFQCVGGNKTSGCFLCNIDRKVCIASGIRQPGAKWDMKSEEQRYSLESLGAECGRFLSIKDSFPQLGTTKGGRFESFYIETISGYTKSIRCGDGRYLSHAYGNVCLMDKIQGDGEKWQAFSKGGTKGFYIECLGAEKGKLLSHAFGKIWLQEGYQGEGELWRFVR